METQNSFDKHKTCKACNKPLPASYQEELCPECIDRALFDEVKDYIRSNDVTEYDVAAHFHIPRHKVMQWIRDGRIEYRDEHLNSIVSTHCRICGTPISFGSLCSKCMKKNNTSVHSKIPTTNRGEMRFIDKQ